MKKETEKSSAVPRYCSTVEVNATCMSLSYPAPLPLCIPCRVSTPLPAQVSSPGVFANRGLAGLELMLQRDGTTTEQARSPHVIVLHWTFNSRPSNVVA